MKKKVVKIEVFKNFKIYYENNQILLNHELGKKLINLFEYFVINKGREVTPDDLEKDIWPDSENPKDVIKYSVFRLRNALNEFDGFDQLNLIKTTENGYMLNDEYEYDIDCLELVKLYEEFSKNPCETPGDYKRLSKITSIYKGRFFLTNNAPFAITVEAERYSSYFSSLIIVLSKYLISKNEYSKMMELNHNAILLEPFYEGLHYYYIKGLIEVKDYHQALKYYDEINEKFYGELGMGLSPQFRELYNIITEDKEKGDKQEISNIKDDIEKHVKEAGGFYCTYEMFKHLYEITVKNAKREGKPSFLVLFSLSKNVSIDDQVVITNKLKTIIEESVRSNDIFARASKTQFVLLLVCNEMDNAYDVVERITSKYYKKYNSEKYRLNYTVQEASVS